MARGNGANGEPIKSNRLEEIHKLKETDYRLRVDFEEDRERTPLIYRANPSLRDLKREHFEAAVISLGLFDRDLESSWADDGQTKGRNSFKIDVLTAFLHDVRKRPEDWVEISEKVVGDPEAMTKLYDRIPCFNLELSGEIQSALALDSIYIASFSLYMSYLSGLIDEKYRLERTFKCLHRENLRAHTFNELIYDILKMENQVPLMLIRNVIDIVVQSLGEDTNTSDDVLRNICREWTAICAEEIPNCKIEKSEHLNFGEYQHIFHCAAEAFWYASKTDTSDKTTEIERRSEGQDPKGDSVPTIEELHKRGVTFEGQEDFFPKFTQKKFAWWKATLSLPTVAFTDHTEMIWRNLLAFESEFAPSEKTFTQYLSFMDNLINTERDVSLLSRGKKKVILGSGLGENKAVAALFNSITKNAVCDQEARWTSLRRAIDTFYNDPYGRDIAEFEEQYFGKPWLVTSVIAAVVLLILTLVQSFYAIWAYYRPS